METSPIGLNPYLVSNLQDKIKRMFVGMQIKSKSKVFSKI